MAEEYVLCNKTDLDSVADAIRTKSGASGAMSFPSDFVSGVSSIEAGGGSIDTCTVTIDKAPSALRNFLIDVVVVEDSKCKIAAYTISANAGQTVNNVVCNSIVRISCVFSAMDGYFATVDDVEYELSGEVFAVDIPDKSGGTVTITLARYG